MHAKLVSLLVILTALLCVSNAAIVSLYIPGNDPDIPLTADKLGVDGQGRTSWRLAVGTSSGSFTDTGPTGTSPNALSQFTATLVEGPSNAHLIEDIPDAGVLNGDCTIKDGISVCTLSVSASGTQNSPVIFTETANLIDVQTSGSGGMGAGPMLVISAAITMGAFLNVLL